jgi:hypothetical protein
MMSGLSMFNIMMGNLPKAPTLPPVVFPMEMVIWGKLWKWDGKAWSTHEMPETKE